MQNGHADAADWGAGDGDAYGEWGDTGSTKLKKYQEKIYTALIYLKGAAAPPAAGPFNSTLHTGDPILGLNVVLLYFITYALHWWHVVSSCVVVNLFLALRALCLAC